MNRGNFFRLSLLTFLSVIFLLSASADATVKLYTATGEDYANEIESQDIAKLRARDKAIKNATKQAGVYLKTYSRSVNAMLTDDEITAITSNAWQIVGEPKYTKKIKQLSDNTTIILWTATVEVNVDDSEIQSWLKRDGNNKSAIISQTREANKSSDENERKIEDLREKYNRATSQADKDNIRKQMNDADREFLAQHKFEDGNKLYYAKDYDGAIKLYNEVLNFGEHSGAYNNRGTAYWYLKQYERAIKDYDKAILLNQNNAQAYNNLGVAYNNLGQYIQAIQYFNKALQINPNYDNAYLNRGNAYSRLKQYNKAIQDYDKAIELNPTSSMFYYNRGNIYDEIGQPERAIQDYNTSIKVNPNDAMAYYNRGVTYESLMQYNQAIQDLNKSIQLNSSYVYAYYIRGNAYKGLKKYEQAIQDYSKAIKLKPNFADAYYSRGLCYRALGENARTQADFAKAKQLGYNG